MIFHRVRSAPSRIPGALLFLLLIPGFLLIPGEAADNGAWRVGTPIVTYWAGPAMTDRTAVQMAEGGWNVVWCQEKELEVAHRHGLRAQLNDPLLTPLSLDNPARHAELEALIRRVKQHPALYSYFITDEPNTTNFAGLGRLVDYLREKDPSHLAYINLFPTYASNEQLGNRGDVVTAYRAHLNDYVRIVKPELISYDHYQFSVKGDNDQYFLNLALIRDKALSSNLPFLNIVQACTWSPSMRVPTSDEMRYLVYTTLAYGAQGISYYVYCWPEHKGGIANPDGTPTAIYPTLQGLNREFVAIAKELQPLQSLRVYHTGMVPPGAAALPSGEPLVLDPPATPIPFRKLEPVQGTLLGYFGPAPKMGQPEVVTHAVVVNLDYRTPAQFSLHGPRKLWIFDASSGVWTPQPGTRFSLQLPPGGGKLLRIR